MKLRMKKERKKMAVKRKKLRKSRKTACEFCSKMFRRRGLKNHQRKCGASKSYIEVNSEASAPNPDIRQILETQRASEQVGYLTRKVRLLEDKVDALLKVIREL